MAYDPRRYLERLERVRKAGMPRFVLVWGLVWGLPFAVVMRFAVDSPLPFYLQLLISYAGGLIWAAWMWGSVMRRYRRLKHDHPVRVV